jgi:hypothetical protein
MLFNRRVISFGSLALVLWFGGKEDKLYCHYVTNCWLRPPVGFVENKELQVGHWVRVLQHKLEPDAKGNSVFGKKYKAQWSKGLYQVTSISRQKETLNQQYHVRREGGDEVPRVFYRTDLQCG